MPVERGYVGMVDREHFDEFLRDRAARAGAERRAGTYLRIERDAEGHPVVVYAPKGEDGAEARIPARMVIGADGANSQVAKQEVTGERPKCVFAYHEIIATPDDGRVDGTRCDVVYDGRLSPDFYSWIFPHGATTSIGTGSAHKGFSLRGAVGALRDRTGLAEARTIRREGAPIPLKPLRTWDNGRDILLAGDAAGVVAPASGEGIYYAMLGGRLAAEAVAEALATGDARALAAARKRFMKDHGQVFWILGIMQTFWYRNDWTRERFVKMCRDPDVQRLTWESYMNKKLVRRDPLAHVKIFFKDLAHLMGIARA
jgi:geranylgeranyl reductase